MHKRFFLPNIVAIIRLSQSNAVTDAIAQIIPFLHGVNLVYEHYLYKKDRVYAGRQHWRCVTTGCPGHVKQTSVILRWLCARKTSHIPEEERPRSQKLKVSVCVDARATPLASLQ